MRLWTIHPQYLDTKGLLAAWREGLLAQKVLLGQTHGYTRHPQLQRFRIGPSAVESIAGYLMGLVNEADRRGYKFDRTKVSVCVLSGKLRETRGQLLFEWSHLKRKLRRRSPKNYRLCCKINIPRAHPLFRIVPGPIQEWEKANSRKLPTSRVAGKPRRGRGAKSRASSRS
ncbi:MAG TPA: pyrimidine dimer DNA glycosylase/endonuclease V [Chthoniobacterales bacterium]|nr:pyrimidine dimer DNA glycosylase/endonuclease V [Chthoniobacterales bacterium]